MSTAYKVVPDNFEDINAFVITDKGQIISDIITKDSCWFYDTCSFRRHANLPKDAVDILLGYIRKKNGVIIITRTILMELASSSGTINEEYIRYMDHIKSYEIDVLILYEEDLFDVMDMCFSTKAEINEYLMWSVREIKIPISTITKTLNEEPELENEIIKGNNMNNRSKYKMFFEAVRSNKVSEDDLGEEILAICLNILSSMPGEPNDKYHVITEDKSAAGRIYDMFKKIKKRKDISHVNICSTPKLVQMMYRDQMLSDRNLIHKLLSTDTVGNIKVLGTRISDLDRKEISLTCAELTDLIMTPNGININF